MQDNTQIRRNNSRIQPPPNSSDQKSQAKESSQSNVGTGQASTSATKAPEEAIDVLTFVGFKL